MGRLRERVGVREITLELSDDARGGVDRVGVYPVYGARQLDHEIQVGCSRLRESRRLGTRKTKCCGPSGRVVQRDGRRLMPNVGATPPLDGHDRSSEISVVEARLDFGIMGSRGVRMACPSAAVIA